MNTTEGDPIRIQLNPANPGHFFACCGFLELAERLCAGAEGWFEEEGTEFRLEWLAPGAEARGRRLVAELAACHLTNTMTEEQRRRRDDLAALKRLGLAGQVALNAEKRLLDALWREAPVRLGTPFELEINWFLDDRAGGSAFKTWAGQQSASQVAANLQTELRRVDWSGIAPSEWLRSAEGVGTSTFNFDSDLGGSGNDRDIGFSLNPLGMSVVSSPLTELAAFVGLQRFRPVSIPRQNRHRFATWSVPLPPSVASAAAHGGVDHACSRLFEYRLLYRTKYLKSFLPAEPVSR